MQDEGTSFGSYKINPLIGALPTFTEDACKEEESVGATCTLPEIETQSLVGDLVTRFVVGDRVTVNASCGDNCFSGGEVGTVVGITLSGNPFVRFTSEDNPDSLALLPSGIHDAVMASEDLDLAVATASRIKRSSQTREEQRPRYSASTPKQFA